MKKEISRGISDILDIILDGSYKPASMLYQAFRAQDMVAEKQQLVQHN